MVASNVQITGLASATDYPLQKKQHTFEKLREWAHLRPRTNTFGAVTRVRNQLSFATHEFFQQDGFVYVHTPLITASDCEGAGQMFRVTTLPLDKLPTVNGKVDNTRTSLPNRLTSPSADNSKGSVRNRIRQDIYVRPNVSRRKLKHFAPTSLSFG